MPPLMTDTDLARSGVPFMTARNDDVSETSAVSLLAVRDEDILLVASEPGSYNAPARTRKVLSRLDLTLLGRLPA